MTRSKDLGGSITPAGRDLLGKIEAVRYRTCRVRANDDLFSTAQALQEAMDDMAGELTGNRDYFFEQAPRHWVSDVRVTCYVALPFVATVLPPTSSSTV